jgi:hypothetical protein
MRIFILVALAFLTVGVVECESYRTRIPVETETDELEVDTDESQDTSNQEAVRKRYLKKHKSKRQTCSLKQFLKRIVGKRDQKCYESPVRIKEVQKVLKMEEIDGHLGPETKKSLELFQSEMDLGVDGIVTQGGETVRALCDKRQMEMQVNKKFRALGVVEWAKCHACKYTVGLIVKKGCGFWARMEILSLCDAAGLGPEDVPADILCTYLATWECRALFKLAFSGNGNPCVSKGYCPST